MTNPKEALEWYERKRVEARAMADRDCNNCKHHKADGCSRWECEYEPKDMVEVVRCKDCKNRNENCGMGEHRWCETINMSTRPDDYCSYGKRREP